METDSFTYSVRRRYVVQHESGKFGNYNANAGMVNESRVFGK